MPAFTPTSDDEESDTVATLIDEAVYQYSQRQNVAPIDLTLERPLDLFAMSPSKRQRFR
jgi:hypothetical protein